MYYIAALVPSMQKGNEGARSAHIALNTVNVGLFGWVRKHPITIS